MNRMSKFQKMTGCFFSGFILYLVLCAPIATGASPDEAYPPAATLDEVREMVEQVPMGHPRLLIDQRGFEALAKKQPGNPLFESLRSLVIEHADSYLEKAPIERVLTGRRLLGKSRECVQRSILLSMAFHLSGDKKYVKRCEQEMLQVAGFEDWNPSHFLDTAEMTLALAIGYDWLYNELDEATRQTVRKAIKEKGVALPFTTRHNGWVKSTNNWGQVCHGGLTAGALAILEHEPELAAKTVHNALQNVTRSMEAFAPKGSYPEGPSYWSYGTTYNVILNELVSSVFGSDFGLSTAPGFVETGQYLSVVTGPSGQTFNYSDGGPGRGAEAAIFWFASRFNRPDWALSEQQLLKEFVAESQNSQRTRYGSRFLPLTLLWMDDASNASENQMPLHWSGEGHVPITVHRSSWTDPNAVFVGLKGGAPSANHGQMDIGSFVLDADGVRWAVDLGAESYHGIESRGMNLWDRSQDSDRWTIFRQQNTGHNTLVIDGQLQVAKNSGTFERFSDDANHAYSLLDMSGVYDGQAKSVKRGLAMTSSNEVLIQDELEGLKPGARVRWGMITPAKVVNNDGSTLELEQDGKTLILTNQSPTKPLSWQVIDVSKPQNEWDSANRNMKMVVLEGKAPASGDINFTVLVTPGSCSQSMGDSLKPIPLSGWGQ